MFNFFKSEQYQPKIYNQLKGQAIESISIAAIAIGPEQFRVYLGDLIEAMEKLRAFPE